MAVAVMHLARTASPPEGEDWVLVERDDSAKFCHDGGVVRHGRGATFYIPDAALETELEAAIEKASSWAATHNLTEVYVREAFHR